ncbi:UNVERIFIED_CONTAM: hypothetical protein NCL1_48774 [Trichonephila clavipes]
MQLAVIPDNVSAIQNMRMSESVKKSIKLLNDGGHHIISKIVMGDETYKPFFWRSSTSRKKTMGL